MELPYQTEVDPTLPHQVILMYDKDYNVVVSCNCRLVSTAGVMLYESMGQTNNVTQSRLIYNNEPNHVGTFTEEDKAKW